ncbi:polyribonucleotide nucleotidyltransferase [Candidatus Roizmanbacteria bacterium RIFCSPHIGHO2_02_FULL_37_13b]|uniref:Polyribonucleotide nucleotidyltransferase n=1 Tax=Candidatus Roizmanbacteria bacterium RIFCSPLOWO2_02_FULL_36_11 TaxID=1802071 RepID=A0A1F7JGF5_9BACT|nr:MAG: polyribonucleotide nucleotidyltransferase [Candidatus Roizmanbacteria bacterium RIFCSPHIGHO2_02_FULL_37_13b]OGK54699.1 MAG: polyribonucleotide nucleotidyltransferase [Candidatus Roizmanbacteria bacterium RIFCSPLOWO2_02_FULL_36_11]
MDIIEETLTLQDRKITLQIGKLAQAADVAIFGRMGDTCVLVTVVVGPERPDMDYFPLMVEYVEKLYAGGRIKGSRWVKREGKASDDAILTARLIDRSIRPLFPKSFKRQVQIVITLLSIDGVNSPELISAITVSAALHISTIPWQGPISTMRVGYIKPNGNEGTIVVNPNEETQAFSTLDLVVSSTESKVVMLETQADQLEEGIITEAINKAKQENDIIIDFIKKLGSKVGKTKSSIPVDPKLEEISTILKKEYLQRIEKLAQKNQAKGEGEELTILVDDIYEKYSDKFDKKKINEVLSYLIFEKIRSNILKNKKRIDGRGIDDVRDLYCETSILPRTHGSAIFQRGQTQVMSVVTLGSPTLEQLIESPEGEEAKRYIHHYYMPPYSVGEVGRMGWPSRREIGHGALAEKAIEPVLPSKETFPYAIRVVSEVMSSNGSTSMASTCGSSLALMDAGVPIKAAVAGISIGLIYKSDEEYVLLTDIAGIEDFAGHMDFKIAGTDHGVTAIQLDVKCDGLTPEMIKETFKKAKVARDKILLKMKSSIDKPRMELSKYAPKVIVLSPPQDKIGEIIGPGGKNIKRIIALTQTDINISDDGKVSVSGIDKENVDKAVELINNIFRQIQVGEEFDGEVKRILPFGAFVELLPGKEGMVHVSKMGKGFVKDPSDVVKIGDKVKVKVIQIDQMNRINLQMIGLDSANESL